ncbi:Lipopolysaccharide export system ATP-binding protein LptB [bacterium HR40]|nr:Lipopolysaccharide export system ATP-binding protein LptB [bacterium HR40]
MTLELLHPLTLEAENLTLPPAALGPLTGVGLAIERTAWVGVLDSEGRTAPALIAALSGSVRLERGTILLAGKPVGHLDARARARLGLLRTFSAAAPVGGRTVGETLVAAMRLATRDTLALLLGGPPQPGEWRAAAEMLALFELEKLLGHPAEGLPAYYRQCIEIARALAMRARVLLLDRPFRGLSAADRERLADILEHRIRPRGVTALLFESDARRLARLCDRILVLHRGRVIAEDVPARIGTQAEVIRTLVG